MSMPPHCIIPKPLSQRYRIFGRKGRETHFRMNKSWRNRSCGNDRVDCGRQRRDGKAGMAGIV